MWRLRRRLWRLLLRSRCSITVAAARAELKIAGYSSGFAVMATDEAIRAVAESAADDVVARQLDLLPGAGNAMAETHAEIVQAVERRGRGRPKGARNVATREVVDFIRRTIGDPLIESARWLLLEPSEMAKLIGCTTAEAYDRQEAVRQYLARYMHAPLAAIDGQGNAVVPRLTMVLGGQHAHLSASGAELPPWEAHLAQLEQNQQLSAPANDASHGAPSHEGENGSNSSGLDQSGR